MLDSTRLFHPMKIAGEDVLADTSIDVRNLLAVSEAITVSAIERKESRGGHFRDDYPVKLASFGGVNFIVRKGADGRMDVSRAPIPEMPDELKRIIEEMK